MPETTDSRRAARYVLWHPNMKPETLAEFEDYFNMGGVGVTLGVDIRYTMAHRVDNSSLLTVFVGSKIDHRVVFTPQMVEELNVSLTAVGATSVSMARDDGHELFVSLRKRASIERCHEVADRLLDYLGIDLVNANCAQWVDVHVEAQYPYQHPR